MSESPSIKVLQEKIAKIKKAMVKKLKKWEQPDVPEADKLCYEGKTKSFAATSDQRTSRMRMDELLGGRKPIQTFIDEITKEISKLLGVQYVGVDEDPGSEPRNERDANDNYYGTHVLLVRKKQKANIPTWMALADSDARRVHRPPVRDCLLSHRAVQIGSEIDMATLISQVISFFRV